MAKLNIRKEDDSVDTMLLGMSQLKESLKLTETLQDEIKAGDCTYHRGRDEYYYLARYNGDNSKFKVYTYAYGKFVKAHPFIIDKGSLFYNELELQNHNAIDPDFSIKNECLTESYSEFIVKWFDNENKKHIESGFDLYERALEWVEEHEDEISSYEIKEVGGYDESLNEERDIKNKDLNDKYNDTIINVVQDLNSIYNDILENDPDQIDFADGGAYIVSEEDKPRIQNLWADVRMTITYTRRNPFNKIVRRIKELKNKYPDCTFYFYKDNRWHDYYQERLHWVQIYVYVGEVPTDKLHFVAGNNLVIENKNGSENITVDKPLTEEANNESLTEGVKGKNRLIYDACTPTRDRRPTTAEDVEDDVCVVDYNSPEDLYDDLLEIAEYDDEEVAEEAESDDLFEKINCLLGWFTDPGDGSPNFLYCVVDGKECDEAMPYDCLDDLDLANCSEEDVIEAVKGEFVEDDDYISVEDCIEYCDGNEEAGNILYDWLDNEDNLYGDIADKDIEDLVDAATNPDEKEIVARALGYDWAIDDYDEDDEEFDESLNEERIPLNDPLKQNSKPEFKARFINNADYSKFKVEGDYEQSIENTMEALSMNPDKLANRFDMAKAFDCTPGDVYRYLHDNYLGEIVYVELASKTGNFRLKEALKESQSQEIGYWYKKFSKEHNMDLDDLVYGPEGFMVSRYPQGFPDFAGDIIYSEKYWDEFEKWLKDTKGIELTHDNQDTFLESSGDTLRNISAADNTIYWHLNTSDKADDDLRNHPYSKTTTQYIRAAYRLATEILYTLSLDEVKDIWAEYNFEKTGPQDKAETIIYNALKRRLNSNSSDPFKSNKHESFNEKSLTEDYSVKHYRGFDLYINNDDLEDYYETGENNLRTIIKDGNEEIEIVNGGYQAARDYIDKNNLKTTLDDCKEAIKNSLEGYCWEIINTLDNTYDDQITYLEDLFTANKSENELFKEIINMIESFAWDNSHPAYETKKKAEKLGIYNVEHKNIFINAFIAALKNIIDSGDANNIFITLAKKFLQAHPNYYDESLNEKVEKTYYRAATLEEPEEVDYGVRSDISGESIEDLDNIYKLVGPRYSGEIVSEQEAIDTIKYDYPLDKYNVNSEGYKYAVELLFSPEAAVALDYSGYSEEELANKTICVVDNKYVCLEEDLEELYRCLLHDYSEDFGIISVNYEDLDFDNYD